MDRAIHLLNNWRLMVISIIFLVVITKIHLPKMVTKKKDMITWTCPSLLLFYNWNVCRGKDEHHSDLHFEKGLKSVYYLKKEVKVKIPHMRHVLNVYGFRVGWCEKSSLLFQSTNSTCSFSLNWSACEAVKNGKKLPVKSWPSYCAFHKMRTIKFKSRLQDCVFRCRQS